MKGTRLFRAPLLVALTLLFASCGGGSSRTADSADSVVRPTSSTDPSPQSSIAIATQAPGALVTDAQVVATDAIIEVPPLKPEDLAGPLIMTAEGIGPFRLGMKATGVIDEMTKMFGRPTEDTGWAQQESPCEGMGSRSRYVSWGRVALAFADGPTAYVTSAGEHLSSYNVFDDPDPIAPAERFVLDDGRPALGRSASEMTAWDKNVTFTVSEIEGPIWSLGNGKGQLGGSMDTPAGAKAARVVSVRAGLICVD